MITLFNVKLKLCFFSHTKTTRI